MIKDYLTIKEVGNLFKNCPKILLNWREKNRIHRHMVDGEVVIKTSDIEHLIKMIPSN